MAAAGGLHLCAMALLGLHSFTHAQSSSGDSFISIRGISDDRGAAYLSRQARSAGSNTNSSFVERVGTELRLDGSRYTYQGFNNYYMLQKASVESTRNQVTEALDLAQRLGLTVMRMWAFTDGSDQFMPLQPQQGRLDPEIFAALDYVISEAQSRSIRVILTLTNYFSDYGGMQQYVEWTNTSNASTVQQFYQDSSIQAAYKDFITAVILRQNTVTGRIYRDDPNILAWDLDWLEMMSDYVKSIDTNHLVYYGTPAYFGASTPERGEYSPYGSLPWDPACQGEDWVRNLRLPNIDLASFHIYPSNSIFDDQVTALRVRGHLDAARTAGKPLIIDEFNAKRPISRRNAFLNQMFDLIDTADSPVVGTNIWMLAADDFGDYDQFEIYGSQAGASNPLPPGPALTSDWAVTLARRAIFRGFVAADSCVRSRFESSRNGGSAFVVGWDATLDILSQDRSFSGPAAAQAG